jgi:hypothetical protein
MWEIQDIQPVKLIVGILACDEAALAISRGVLLDAYGEADLVSEVWPFDMTEYYINEAGPDMVRQFMAFENLIDPGRLAAIKHETNRMEQDLAKQLDTRSSTKPTAWSRIWRNSWIRRTRGRSILIPVLSNRPN